MARQVLPIVGAAITTYFGMGPQLGWAIGSIVGNVVDPVVNKGPSIGDLAQQTSQEGVPRPIVFGVSPPMGGNIILCSDPKIITKRERQGKGGPINETQHVYRTYAIGVCEGPINAFLRVWRNGNLVYDVRPGHKQVQDAAFIKYARFFLGGWSQAQSPDLVAVKGADDTPFFRATAYLVMANEDLTDLRGAVPQYAFQVLRCEGTVLTSRPYPVSFDDGIVAAPQPEESRLFGPPMVFDEIGAVGTPQDGYLNIVVKQPGIVIESIVATGTPLDGSITRLNTQSYDVAAEGIVATGTPLDGLLETSQVGYNIPYESIVATGTPLDGELA